MSPKIVAGPVERLCEPAQIATEAARMGAVGIVTFSTAAMHGQTVSESRRISLCSGTIYRMHPHRRKVSVFVSFRFVERFNPVALHNPQHQPRLADGNSHHELRRGILPQLLLEIETMKSSSIILA